MTESSFFRIRIFVTSTVSIVIWLLLAWNHYHGGIPSHHILADKDLPEISNLWGAILLPVLTWFLLYRVQKRIISQSNGYAAQVLIRYAIYSFAFSLAFGIAAACFFSYGYPDMTGNLMLGILVVALFFPVYRAECLLGFVIGMSVTFGAVLPTAIGSILASIAFVLFRGVRPAVLYVVSRIRRT